MHNISWRRQLTRLLAVLLVALGAGLTQTTALAATKAATSSSVTLSPGSVTVAGRSIIAAGTVTSEGTAPLEGMLTFVVDGVDYVTTTLSGATAATTLPVDVVGEHTVSVRYHGNASYEESRSTDTSYTVGKATPIVKTVVPTAPASTVDVIAVEVSAENSTVKPTGTVGVTDITGSPRKQYDTLTLVNGKASFALTGFSPGDHTLRFEYSGDGSVLGVSNVTDVTIQADARSGTQTDLFLDRVSTHVGGTAITATARIDAGQATAVSGSVRFVGGSLDQEVPVSAAGVAEMTLPTDTAVSARVAAFYSGDASHQPSRSIQRGYTITKASTTTAAVPPRDAVDPSTSIPIVVSAVDSTAKPTGNVAVTVDGRTAGTVELDSSGAGEFVLTGLSAGVHTLGFAYGGDEHTKSSAVVVSVTIKADPDPDPGTKADSTVEVTVPDGPVEASAVVPVKVTSTGAQVPAGVVAVTELGVARGTVELDSSGAGEFALTGLSAGVHTLGFAYGGDEHTKSSAVVVSVTIKADPDPDPGTKAPTSTVLTLSPARAVVGGAPVRALVTVFADDPSIIDGEVTVTVATQAPFDADLVGGLAEIELSVEAVAADVPVRIDYAGDATHQASHATGSYSVVKARTITAVTVPPQPVGTDELLPVTVETVQTSIKANGDLHVAGADVERTIEVVDGVAEFGLAGMRPGEHELTFTWEGDGSTEASSATTTMVVKQTAADGETSTELLLDRETAPVLGDDVLATAEVTGPAGIAVTGWVAFSIDGWLRLVELDDGAATTELPVDAPRTSTVRAIYLGASELNSSSSAERSYRVVKAAATISVEVPASEVEPNATLPIKVVADQSSAVPGGRLTFSEGGSAPVEVPLTKGVGTLTLPTLSPGSHTLDLAYEGDAYTEPRQQSVTVIVRGTPTKATTTSTLTLDRTAASIGGPALTATAAVAVAGGSAPDGQVSIVLDGSVLATKPATVLPVSFPLPVDKIGAHQVQVRYSGSTTQAGSESAAQTYTVTPAQTQAAQPVSALVSAKTKALKKHKIRVTATVSAAAPVSGKVQVLQLVKVKKHGKVTTKLKVVGTATIKSAGTRVTVAITTKKLQKGRQTFTVRYLGSPQVLRAEKTIKVKVK